MLADAVSHTFGILKTAASKINECNVCLIGLSKENILWFNVAVNDL